MMTLNAGLLRLIGCGLLGTGVLAGLALPGLASPGLGQAGASGTGAAPGGGQPPAGAHAGQTGPTGPAGPTGPTDAKAAKTFADAAKLLMEHQYFFALDGFRKADKQDGGHCVSCEVQAYVAATQMNNFKAEREEATALQANVTAPGDKAQAHFLAGKACLAEGNGKSDTKPFEAADMEFQAGLQIEPRSTECLYGDGVALAHLKQDGTARERFQQYLKLAGPQDIDYARAKRFAESPELARGRVAPNFRLTTLDGKTVTLESLAGKVVLIDFWATWCGPCREALPHVRQIAHRFEGQPFVVMSISLDKEDDKWKEFVAKNNMTWIQARDGYFDGPVATIFGVTAIPATFTIDADGVLQDQHVGDADIEGKLKKLIAQATDEASKKTLATK